VVEAAGTDPEPVYEAFAAYPATGGAPGDNDEDTVGPVR
jgi:hypothetical protein